MASSIREKITTKDMRSSWGIRCVLPLSMLVAAGLFCFGLAGLFFSSDVISFIEQGRIPDYLYFWRENLLFFFRANKAFYVFMAILSAFSLYACVLMWSGHRSGVSLYAISKVGLLGVPVMFFSYRGLSYGDVMLAVLFIVYYYIYMLRHPYTEEKNPNRIADQRNKDTEKPIQKKEN